MKVALIELGSSHDECLYAQIRYIKSVGDTYVSLIFNKNLEQQVSYYDGVDEKIPYYPQRGLKQWSELYRLKTLIRKGRYDYIVLNTADGKTIRNFLLLNPGNGATVIGILHSVSKLSNSGTQKIISRYISSYFVLHDYLIDQEKRVSSKRQLHSFYPMFFPDYPDVSIQKGKDHIWICIPGQVELKRRDYISLLDSIEKFGVSTNIRFVLLGRCSHSHGAGNYVKKRIKELGVEDNFILWDDFIDVETFHAVMRQSDYILLLIHSNHTSKKLYTNQISGAFNLGFGYKIPFLLENGIYDDTDIAENAIQYDVPTMMRTINQLSFPSKKEYYNGEKWTFDSQSRRYLKVFDVEF